MPEFHVLRHVIRPHEPVGNEEYDPGSDMLIVVHKNPHDPDDPTEFGHHIRLHGLAYRKEMWGLPDMASTIDMELRDLERYYHRQEGVEYGPHPLADLTEHYFNGPPEKMRSFTPEYVMRRVMPTVTPKTPDGVMKLCIDTALSGIEDVKTCLGSQKKHAFPCKGMTGLSSETVDRRTNLMNKMEEQTQQIELVSSKALDDVRQLLTDRESELDRVREGFVTHALMTAKVPEIMRQRAVQAAARQGLLPERFLS